MPRLLALVACLTTSLTLAGCASTQPRAKGASQKPAETEVSEDDAARQARYREYLEQYGGQ